MPSWRLARSLEVLRAELNAAWPNRGKAADGTIGDAAHASRKSDHNPWVRDGRMGVVTAIDIDDDGGRLDHLPEHFRPLGSAGDRRVKYIIANGRIASPTGNWAWRPYKGPNGHFKHGHLSVSPDLRCCDSRESWNLERLTAGKPVVVTAAAATVVRPTLVIPGVPSFQRVLRATMLNDSAARQWQAQMRRRGWKISVDGDYGPGSAGVCRQFQRDKRLTVDGEVGPITWRATWNPPVT